MIALIQRVSRASVTVADEVTGEIGPGLLVLLGVEKDDDEQKANRLCERVLGYRIFSDGRENEPECPAGGRQRAGGFAIYAGGRYRAGDATELLERRCP